MVYGFSLLITFLFFVTTHTTITAMLYSYIGLLYGPILSCVHLFQCRCAFHIFSQDWCVNLGRPLNHCRGTFPLAASLLLACSFVTLITYSLLNFLGRASVPNTRPGKDEMAIANYTQPYTTCQQKLIITSADAFHVDQYKLINQ